MHPKLMLYSGRPKKNSAGPCVSEAADKDSTLGSMSGLEDTTAFETGDVHFHQKMQSVIPHKL